MVEIWWKCEKKWLVHRRRLVWCLQMTSSLSSSSPESDMQAVHLKRMTFSAHSRCAWPGHFTHFPPEQPQWHFLCLLHFAVAFFADGHAPFCWKHNLKQFNDAENTTDFADPLGPKAHVSCLCRHFGENWKYPKTNTIFVFLGKFHMEIHSLDFYLRWIDALHTAEKKLFRFSKNTFFMNDAVTRVTDAYRQPKWHLEMSFVAMHHHSCRASDSK